mmetsp:Transcript_13236/g.21536  ORF Transcript_13236/g.21536 Transcript_13236/m.21536 type:complete len:225 (+) Transcript_13236:39-713(+)
MSKPRLTYFDIQGVAEAVRLALVLNKIDFEDNRIKHAEWAELKQTAKFGQLPLFEREGKPTLAQSGAMLRYAGRLGDGSLYPQDPEKMAQVEEMDGLVGDMIKAWGPCLYMGMAPHKFGYEEGSQKTDEGKARVKALREQFLANDLPRFMGYFTKQLKDSGGGFLCGDTLTIADLRFVPFIRGFQRGFMDYVPKDCLDTFPAITSYLDRVLSVPEISEWYKTHK